MEYIKKTVSLETAKNRAVNDFNVLSGTNYVLDSMVRVLTLKERTIADYVPLLKKEGILQKRILRYKNLMRHYYWFNNEFIPSCTYQRCCIRNGEKVWVNFSYTEDEEIYNNPFMNSGITDSTINSFFEITTATTTGTTVCITPLYNKLIEKYDAYTTAKTIYNFVVNQVENDGQYNGTETPYLNFTVYLDQNVVDEGLLSPYVEVWIPGKKYYIGDVVYYSEDGSVENMKTYKLINGETTEINGETTEVDYYSGYYDENKRFIYFDSSSGAHWQEYIDNITGNTAVTGLTESMLRNVMRKKTDMDISGNTLPFILHYNIVNDSRVLSGGVSEMQFMCGAMNIKGSDKNTKMVCDYLSSVTFCSGETEICTFSGINTPIIIQGNNNIGYEADGEIITNCNKIKFIYYLDATLNSGSTWTLEENSGVKYEEVRPIALKTENYNIEVEGGYENYDFPYIEIGSNSEEYSSYDNIDLLNSMRTVDYATVYVSSGQTDNDYFLLQNTELADKTHESNYVYKREDMMGLQNSYNEVNAEIERGISESFQRHNMFGEICSLQDLENYKNGKFLS